MKDDVASRPADARAVEAIRRVLFRYGEYVDRLHVDAVLELFTDDATFDFGFGRVFAGREQLRELFERLSLNEATSHHISNAIIDVDGDEARASSVVYAYHRRAATGEEVHLWGRYDDELVIDRERWRFRRRVLRAAAERGIEPAPGQATFYEPIDRHVE